MRLGAAKTRRESAKSPDDQATICRALYRTICAFFPTRWRLGRGSKKGCRDDHHSLKSPACSCVSITNRALLAVREIKRARAVIAPLQWQPPNLLRCVKLLPATNCGKRKSLGVAAIRQRLTNPSPLFEITPCARASRSRCECYLYLVYRYAKTINTMHSANGLKAISRCKRVSILGGYVASHYLFVERSTAGRFRPMKSLLSA